MSRLPGPNFGAHCLEAVGVNFTLGPQEHVFGGYQLYIGQTGGLYGVQVLSLQESAADSSGPEIHVLLDRIGHRFVDHDVSQVQPSAGLQDPEHLIETRRFVGG